MLRMIFSKSKISFMCNAKMKENKYRLKSNPENRLNKAMIKG